MKLIGPMVAVNEVQDVVWKKSLPQFEPLRNMVQTPIYLVFIGIWYCGFMIEVLYGKWKHKWKHLKNLGHGTMQIQSTNDIGTSDFNSLSFILWFFQ